MLIQSLLSVLSFFPSVYSPRFTSQSSFSFFSPLTHFRSSVITLPPSLPSISLPSYFFYLLFFSLPLSLPSSVSLSIFNNLFHTIWVSFVCMNCIFCICYSTCVNYWALFLCLVFRFLFMFRRIFILVIIIPTSIIPVKNEKNISLQCRYFCLGLGYHECYVQNQCPSLAFLRRIRISNCPQLCPSLLEDSV